jgi:hypothetical protein
VALRVQAPVYVRTYFDTHLAKINDTGP